MENKKLDKQSLMAMIKSISIEKWLLIGGAGVVLILCSDLLGQGIRMKLRIQVTAIHM